MTNITSLNKNDVLLGRGTGPNSFAGNDRFRRRLDARRKEYVSGARADKARIAQELVDEIHSLGGRFVRQVRKGRWQGDVLVDGQWDEVNNDVAVEKVKQALRQKKHGEKPSGGADDIKESTSYRSESTASLEGGANQLSVRPPPLNGLDPRASLNPLCVPLFLPSYTKPTAAIDARLLLFPRNDYMPVFSHQLLATQSILFGQPVGGLLPSLIPNPSTSLTPFNTRQAEAHLSLSNKERLPVEQVETTRKHRLEETNANRTQQTMDFGRNSVMNLKTEAVSSVKKLPTTDLVASAPLRDSSRDEDVAAYVLASLALDNRPMVTSEDRERELASLTSDERSAALADLFGKMNINDPQSKKAKNDLDRESIDFLVGRMRFEIEKIPYNEKRALMEAQVSCRSEEFSSSRLEQFLRCEGMNAELAAKRFAMYWEKRRETFGPKKFTMQMILSEALKDDIVAMEAGVYNLLPLKDLSGRQVLFVLPHNHTGEGYTSDSLLRAVWYIAEVAASKNTHVRCGLVDVVWLKDVSIFDYDQKVFDRALTYFQNVWPVKSIAAHLCCPSGIFVRYVVPIVHAVIDTWIRSRTRVHNVPESEIVSTLHEYGIQKEMLPTVMGGSLELDPSGWIAHRRAVEMEELL